MCLLRGPFLSFDTAVGSIKYLCWLVHFWILKLLIDWVAHLYDFFLYNPLCCNSMSMAMASSIMQWLTGFISSSTPSQSTVLVRKQNFQVLMLLLTWRGGFWVIISLKGDISLLVQQPVYVWWCQFFVPIWKLYCGSLNCYNFHRVLRSTWYMQ